MERPAANKNELLTSWLWGERAGRGEIVSARSPLDGALLGRTRSLDEGELELLLASLEQPVSLAPAEVRAFAVRLHAELEALSPQIFEALQLGTAFVRADCLEVREGILSFVRDFCDAGWSPFAAPPPQLYEAAGGRRVLRRIAVPWGTIAVVLPASAALFLGVTCLLNALATGNRVILRFPASCPLSAATVCRALERARVPANAASVVMAPAKLLIGALHGAKSPILIHYLGSSRHAAKLIAQGFEHRQSVIADAEGNAWVWVDQNADPAWSAQILMQGAVRYNGQTCTSVNGALVHPALYEAVRAQLVARWKALVAGDPRDERTDVGPLLDEEQARWCLERIEASGGRVLCGGQREGNLLHPTLVEGPLPQSELVTQGLFGPALWIGRASEEEFAALWPSNRFPLCAAILSPDGEGALWSARLGNAARVVMNGDPSVEWTFEPWGGYPASGNNPVSAWADKYRRVVALDERAKD